MTPRFILVDSGYKTRFDIIDFRTRRYRLFKTCGVEVKFSPLPDKAAVDEQLRRKAHEEYMNSPAGRSEKAGEERRKNGTSITWGKISELLEQGKTPDQIVKILQTTDWVVKGLITRHRKLDEKEREAMKAKITREELYAEAKERGTGKDALNAIAGKYGLKASSIDLYLTDWGIRKQLREESAGVTIHQEEEKKIVPEKSEIVPESVSIDKVGQNAPEPAATREHIKDTIIVSEETMDNLIKNLPEGVKVETIDEIEDQEQLARDREAIRELNPIEKAIKEAGYEINAEIANKTGSISLASTRAKLKPVCMRGTRTAREYIFTEAGVAIGRDMIAWEEIDNLIVELQAVKEMRSA
jgi:hypothetical protein